MNYYFMSDLDIYEDWAKNWPDMGLMATYYSVDLTILETRIESGLKTVIKQKYEQINNTNIQFRA